MDIDADIKQEAQEAKIKQEFKTTQTVFLANNSTVFELTADYLYTEMHTFGNYTEETGIVLFSKLSLNTRYQELLNFLWNSSIAS